MIAATLVSSAAFASGASGDVSTAVADCDGLQPSIVGTHTDDVIVGT